MELGWSRTPLLSVDYREREGGDLGKREGLLGVEGFTFIRLGGERERKRGGEDRGVQPVTNHDLPFPRSSTSSCTTKALPMTALGPPSGICTYQRNIYKQTMDQVEPLEMC